MAPSAIATITEYTNKLFLENLEQSDYSLAVKNPGDHVYQDSKQLIGAALKKRVENIDSETCGVGEEDAFFVADMGEVYRQHLRWKMNLKRVKPHYAVKCNPDPQVLRLLAELGTGFDCASKAEIEQVIKMGVDPSRIIYAQPCKTKSYVRYAAQQGVKQMTFDNADELYKIKQLFPGAELFLRILTDDSASLCRLSLKFGASLDSTQDLLELAKKLELNVVGVAFHVGSGASDPAAFLKAVQDARVVFDQAEALGFQLHTLDVGGGFVSETFDAMAAVLSDALDVHFPPHIRIIGEPGRYYVANAFTIACNVIARRTVHDPELGTTSYMLYLNDGVYGNFSSIMFDHQHPVPRILKAGDRILFGEHEDSYELESGGKLPTEYSIWGPTCDGIDCISASCTLPETLDVGDWLYFEEMGAYTKCSATRFNGFTDCHETVYVSSEAGASALLGL
ncbi:ornithine decarboxylase [Coniosporium apollinis CBS 100218]|uniref:Ornithine decarboxylase n=1 Tax=Coniosporium apollinis (strain CBS 100218) TaxID=1168221 RepID=R7YXT3_CONA1|nr:ornithine decarboxylase [Coniosporium apollinis CBS 100218]EON66712.1 ornithine decarboxylase [Coniosporium apollinis CBS 100218]